MAESEMRIVCHKWICGFLEAEDDSKNDVNLPDIELEPSDWSCSWDESSAEQEIMLEADTVKPLFVVFVGGLKKKQWIRENNRCGSQSLNRIHSGTLEIEGRIWENELSGNDR
jgi:hypothetical protein